MSDFRDPEAERIKWAIDFGLDHNDTSEAENSAWNCGYANAQMRLIAQMNFRVAQKEREFKEFLQHLFDEGYDVLTIKDFEAWQFNRAEKKKKEQEDG